MELVNDLKNNGIDQLKRHVWAKLIPLSKGLATYELSYDKTLVGRSAECFIRINDKRLSGKHCIINKRDDNIYILDLSTNGTFVNNNKIGKNIEKEVVD
jgi:predicted component of type VI protein secretion system